MDFEQLQAFIFAAETLSFSEAAKQLHLSQPTVSHRIKTLERDLGVELFTRTGSRIKLTEAGRLLLPTARRLVRQSIEIKLMVASMQQEVAGHLRIACSTTAGKYVLAQFAARFHQRHPDVRISILRCTSEHVVPSLLEEEANLGVVSYDVCGDGLECQEFLIDHIVLIVPADHPWALREHVELTELLEMPFVIREPSSGTRQVMLVELGKYDIALDDMNIFLEVGNAEAIVKTVEDGFGVSFVSRLAAAWALDRGSVVEVPVAGVDLRRKIFMVRKDIQEANRAMDAFWGFVHDPSNADLLYLAEK
jgi:DNA-binding transcriptional LysR family regulator